MKERVGERVKLTSYNDLLGVGDEQSSIDLEITRIKPFKNHPFKVRRDAKMEDLINSVMENGILTPVLVRPVGEDYEMISGHRRMFAAQCCKKNTIPAIIKEMTDDEATVAMVDANIQREELLPSEKAFAYKMKLEAIKRQGSRDKTTSTQNGWKYESAQIIGREVGKSKNQVRRYIRLTELIPDLLELVDKKRLLFTVAVEISYVEKNVQEWLYKYICDCGSINMQQIIALRKALENESITQEQMVRILNNSWKRKSTNRKVTLKAEKLDRFFPPEYSVAQMEHIIEQLLESWNKGEEEEHNEI